jgi:uncharacterized protein (DUF3084 family)
MSQNHLSTVAAFSPDLLQSPSAWLGHLPFAAWIVREVSPQTFVELGTHYGHSFFSFCQSVVEAGLSTKCYAVDTWQGDEHAGQYGDEIFEKVNNYHLEKYAGFARLLRTTFDDAVTYFADESIDLLHIDGLHTYEAVRHDFETWLPKLAPNAVVMFHDTNVRERNFGVWKLWAELQVIYPNNLEFVHSHGLGVLQLNSVPPLKRLPWLEPNSPNKETLKTYFAALGLRQLERFDLIELKKHSAVLTQAATLHSGQIATLSQTVSDRDSQIATLSQAVSERDSQIATLSQAVSERDSKIANISQAVSERDGQFATFSQAVSERNGQIATLSQAVSERDNRIVSLSQAISDRDSQIITLTHAVLERDTQIASLSQEAVAEQEILISSLNQSLFERDNQITNLTQNVSVCESQIAGLNQLIFERDNQINSLSQDASVRESQIAGLNQLIFERDNQINSLSQDASVRESQIVNLNQFIFERDGQIASLHAQINEIRGSRSWRITAPYRALGRQIGRIRTVWRILPKVLNYGGGPVNTISKALPIYRNEGLEGVKRRLASFQTTAVNPNPLPYPTTIQYVNTTKSEGSAVPTARQMLVGRFGNAIPLSVFPVPNAGQKRISILTDSINQGSLFGGVGTAMILTALLAIRHGARLRVVTRTERALPANLHAVLALYGITLDTEVEFAFANIHSPQAIDVFEDELFVTTSWWTTEAALDSIAPSRILYVLQEDERMFYPGGDDHLRCSQLLLRKGLHIAVNTQGLLDHLISSGLPHLARTAVAFEPAFPAHIYRRRPRESDSRRRLLYYARPNHARNLFYFGLDVIDSALARGIIDPKKWDIFLVGAHIPALQFCDGTKAQHVEGLSWQQYADLAGTIDVGLCLMYTPHPSYPPLDLAASEAVVVTNRFGNKQSMTSYCDNILSSDLDLESMLTTLQQALLLAEDEPERLRRFRAHRLQPDWQTALAPVIERWSKGSHV